MSTPFDTAPVFIPDVPINEDPISNGGKWTYISGSALRRAGGGYTTTQPGGAVGTMLWNADFFEDGAICWIYNNNPALGESITMYLRSSTTLSTSYFGVWNSTPSPDEWKIGKVVSGVQSTLTSTGSGPSTAFLAGDRIGFATEGTTISLWYQERAGVATPSALNANWTQVLTATDSAITGSGYTALSLGGIENEWYGARGGATFPVGGTGSGGGGSVAAGSPTFNVQIRTVTTP
jgi:hypothetical protein